MQNRGEKGKNEDYVGPFIYLVYLVMLINFYFVDIKKKQKIMEKTIIVNIQTRFVAFVTQKAMW